MPIDTYPQWLNMTPVSEAAAGTFIEQQTVMPVRIDNRQVLEILGVETEISGGSQSAVDADTEVEIVIQLTKRTQTARVALQDPDIVHLRSQLVAQQYAEATETGGGPYSYSKTRYTDYASGGKGFLVAAQSLFLGVVGSATIAVVTARCRFLYRLVKVSAEELIGLVQQ